MRRLILAALCAALLPSVSGCALDTVRYEASDSFSGDGLKAGEAATADRRAKQGMNLIDQIYYGLGGVPPTTSDASAYANSASGARTVGITGQYVEPTEPTYDGSADRHACWGIGCP